MVGNIWFDRASHELIYNIEDPRYALLSANADVDDNNEIDPTQRVATTDGRSPRALLSSSFSDELAARYGGASKIFGVSIKDRGAVPLAGLILLIHNVSATAPISLVMTAFFCKFGRVALPDTGFQKMIAWNDQKIVNLRERNRETSIVFHSRQLSCCL